MMRQKSLNKDLNMLGNETRSDRVDHPPIYEGSDPNNNNEKEQSNEKPLDNLEEIDIEEKETTDATKDLQKSQTKENWCNRAFRLSTYDPRNGTMWKETEGDKLHILVLFFLYILQGIPLGLKSSVPLVLQERGVSYSEQSKFSFSNYPFSMKILWAPIVDAIFIKKFGRRKSWLIPTQILIGITMLVLSQYVDILIGPDPDNIFKRNASSLMTEFVNQTEGRIQLSSASLHDTPFMPDVTSLTIAFFFLTFFAATQDVAVDGWALTMLKPKNVGYAATCNSIGQTTGWCLGYILYTILDDAGIIDLSQFFLFWGIVFIVTTLIIAIFKKEKSQQTLEKEEKGNDKKESEDEQNLGIVETYQVIWKIICHPLMPPLIIFLFSAGLPFAVSESMSSLRLISAGVPKGRIARVSIWMIPVKIIMTFIITRYTVGPRPMNAWLWCLPLRILLSLAFMVLVYVTPFYQQDDGTFPMEYYVLMIFISAIHRAVLYGMFVGLIAFFARISDPAVGGTNMTFFNTLANLGGMWPDTFFLWFVDVITYKTCVPTEHQELSSPLIFKNDTLANSTILDENFCLDDAETKICKAAGGGCDVTTDGYYILCLASSAFGLVWMIWAWRTIKRLQEIDVMEWRVTKSKSISCYGLTDVIVNKISGLKK